MQKYQFVKSHLYLIFYCTKRQECARFCRFCAIYLAVCIKNRTFAAVLKR